jgi:hypothetical protein
MSSDPLKQVGGVKSFHRDLYGDEFAHCVARIMLGWGGTEYRLFKLLEAIDTSQASTWAGKLFKPRSLAQRKDIVRAQIALAVKKSYPKFVDNLEDQLTKLQSVQFRRNIIAHGLWLPGASDTDFLVQPLNLQNGSAMLEQAVKVDLTYLGDMIQDIEFLEQGLSSLGAEMLAHQSLKKRGLR